MKRNNLIEAILILTAEPSHEELEKLTMSDLRNILFVLRYSAENTEEQRKGLIIKMSWFRYLFADLPR